MTAQDITIAVSILTVVSGGINVYVGLRLSALQAQMKADAAAEQQRAADEAVRQAMEQARLTNTAPPRYEPNPRPVHPIRFLHRFHILLALDSHNI